MCVCVCARAAHVREREREKERERERESIGRRQARQKEDEMHVQRPTNPEST